MRKKFLILSLSLILGLTACGASDTKEAASLQTSAEQETESSAQAADLTSLTGAETPADGAAAGNEVSGNDSTVGSGAAGSDVSGNDAAVGNDAAGGDTASASSTTGTPVPNKDKYLNIAIFGLDVNTNLTKDSEGRWKQLMKGFRSDCIMIASINKETGDVKLVSVYRDTFLNTGNDNYHKANAAYSAGGPLQAVKMLNMNLDLDIDKYMAISYHSMMDLVNGLGGITVDVEKAALNEINGYQNTIVNDLGLPSYTAVTESGVQTLNGLQVCAYCRLRHDFPRGDLDRAAHQRKVLKAIEEKVKQTDGETLITIFNKVVDEISTNFDTLELLELVTNVDNYHIAGESGFPADKMVAMGTLGKEGSCVIAMNLEDNVVWLHEFLFDEKDYTPSATMKEINETIEAKIAPYNIKK